jgi:dipeptidyl aminopeptidase/acylaminoacyl peptidase
LTAATDAADGRVFRDRVQPNWSAGNTHFWYRVTTGAEQHEFVLVDAENGTRHPAFDHRRLAEVLVKAGVKDARAERLPIDRLEFQLAEQTISFRCANQTWRCSLKTYDVVKPDAPAGGVKPDAPAREASGANLLQAVDGGPKASKRTGPETSVTFINRTAGEVELFWLDPQGERRSYGKLHAGHQRDQHTFAGHVWLAVDEKGKPLGVHQAEEQPATVEITGKTAPRSTRDGRRDKPDRPRQRERPSRDGNSPDGRWHAFIKDHNVRAKDTAGGAEFALSTDGTAENAYGGGLYWSPDSKKLVAVRTKKIEERKVHFIESSPRDQVQPKLHTISYNKPGDMLPIERPQLFDVAAKRQIPVSDALFDNPFSIRDIRWARDSSRFTFVYNQRGHQALRLLAVDAESGSVRPIIDEKSETFIDYSGKYFLHYLDETGEVIWMSERDGWNHLYLYDARTGKVKNQITKGEWVVRGVERIDEAARQVWFRAGGIRPGQDPYFIHYCRVNFDGSGLTVLTEGDGTHQIEFSPDRRFLLDRYSRVDLPSVTELRRTADGKLVCALERADASEVLKSGWRPPEAFVAKGRDGTTDIYGVICRPRNLDPAKKYPVVEEIYAGPQGSFVPKGFSTRTPGQSLTDLGFIVVKIDGMGTSNRSKKFHDVCWKNLADAGFLDRIAWLKAAAVKYPYMDLSRVGIYGGSAGGQNAACAVMTHGDFYKVAVADCGCHDNRMDKLWWNEQWMGWPVGPHYAANSNVTLAPGLRGKLLLIVGEMDTNVDPASTMQVVNALIKADKDFDMLVVPGAGHGAAGTPYAVRRQRDYFVRHLMGTER